jgi:hypothetical protein
MNHKVGTAGRSQPGRKTAALCLVRVTNTPRQRWSGYLDRLLTLYLALTIHKVSDTLSEIN